MLPTQDAERTGAELTRRFGLERWSFSLTATDANRWAIWAADYDILLATDSPEETITASRSAKPVL